MLVWYWLRLGFYVAYEEISSEAGLWFETGCMAFFGWALLVWMKFVGLFVTCLFLMNKLISIGRLQACWGSGLECWLCSLLSLRHISGLMHWLKQVTGLAWGETEFRFMATGLWLNVCMFYAGFWSQACLFSCRLFDFVWSLQAWVLKGLCYVIVWGSFEIFGQFVLFLLCILPPFLLISTVCFISLSLKPAVSLSTSFTLSLFSQKSIFYCLSVLFLKK